MAVDPQVHRQDAVRHGTGGGHGPVAAGTPGLGRRAGLLMQYAGAALSLALIGGVGVWGYKLLVRDVTGIPVVRAMEGPMRAAPENPGGEVAANTGLAVNAVAAVGQAAPPEDRLVLAPPPPELLPEDLAPVDGPAAEGAPLPEDGSVSAAMTDAAGLPVDPAAASGPAEALPGALDAALAGAAPAPGDPSLAGHAAGAGAGAEAPGSVPAPESALAEAPAAPLASDAEPAPLNDAQILALADQIAAGLGASVVPDPATLPEEDLAQAGPGQSLRPVLRPTARFAATVTTATPAIAADVVAARTPPAPARVTTDPIPVGTSLVQLGAFDSAEIAGQEWERLSGRFAAFMAGKQRVIQEATSGGRQFYRLRAMGFADLGDARRFCSALVAEDAACIPVVVR